MDQKQYELIAHSLGVDTSKPLPDYFYRNRFVAGDSYEDRGILHSLQNLKYMDCSEEKENLGGSRAWWVIEEGIKQFREIHFSKYKRRWPIIHH